jgi:hypothetical protein
MQAIQHLLEAFTQCPFRGATRFLTVPDRFRRLNQRSQCWSNPAPCGVDQKVLSVETHEALGNPKVLDVECKVVAGGRFAEPALRNQKPVRIEAVGNSPFYFTGRKVIVAASRGTDYPGPVSVWELEVEVEPSAS